MNEYLQHVRPHSVKQIADAVARDPSIIDLSIGVPSFGPPDQVLDTAVGRLLQRAEEPAESYTRYAHSRGTPALRQAIAQRYRRLYGLAIDPDRQVLVTHGAAQAIWLTIFTLTNAGDEIIIPDPCYVLYEPIALSLGRRPVRVATRPEQGFLLSIDDLRTAVTPRTRLLMINSPENPTGAVYDRERLKAIMQLAHEKAFHVLHDEVFDAFSYAHQHLPLLALDPDGSRAIMAGSLSKSLGMTGWRIGWMIAPPEVVEQAAKAHTYMTLAAGTLAQEAVAAALNDEAIAELTAKRTAAIRERGRHFLQGLLEIDGFTAPAGPPGGTFYLFVCVADLHRAMPRQAVTSDSISESVARYLLETCKVAAVPGIGFGPSGDAYLRFCAGAPPAALQEALTRLRARLGSRA